MPLPTRSPLTRTQHEHHRRDRRRRHPRCRRQFLRPSLDPLRGALGCVGRRRAHHDRTVVLLHRLSTSTVDAQTAARQWTTDQRSQSHLPQREWRSQPQGFEVLFRRPGGVGRGVVDRLLLGRGDGEHTRLGEMRHAAFGHVIRDM